ncbi:MAG: Lpg1974 family pore-forming outer membrane protein [Anaerolineae bacterium]
MDLKQTKLWPAAAASLVALTSVLNAADDAQMRNLENRVSALEQRKGANGMINPPARPEAKDGCGLFVTGDVLYWKAHENGLTYGIKNEHTNFTPGQTRINDGETKNPDFDWDFGFRVGVGYAMPHDGWDLYLNWTHFHTDGDVEDHARTRDGKVIFPTQINPNLVDFYSLYATEAENRWRLRLNVLDLELGREFFVSKWLTLRPHMGLRAAWVDQKYRVTYEGGTLVPTDGQKIKIKDRNNFRGLGLRGGLDSQWGLGGGWCIYGNAAISLIYGHFEIDEKQKLRQNDATLQKQLDLDHDFHLSRAITDLALGLRWEQSFADDAFFVSIQGGWENHVYFGQNQLIRFVDDVVPGAYVTNQGDLTIQGWVGSITFAF